MAGAEVEQVLERLFASRHFVSAHQKKKFLRFICDEYLAGRAQELNEHRLGHEVFSRDSSYNPAEDPIVRVFAHEIRKKLDAYYANEGADAELRLEIPAGSYQPVFIRREKAPPPEASVADVPPHPLATDAGTSAPTRRRPSAVRLALSLAVFCLTIAVIGLVLANRQLRQELAQTAAAKDPARWGSIWQPFLKDESPPLVVLSNPPVLRFTNASDPQELLKDALALPPETVRALRDKFVMNPEVTMREPVGDATAEVVASQAGAGAAATSERGAQGRAAPPRLILSTTAYTGVGEAIGLHYLTDFFRQTGRGILLKQSRTLSAEDLKKHNVIMLGGLWVNEWSSRLASREDFVFTGRATIENRNPQTGEERDYVPQFDRRTGNLLVDYALITVKPNITEANDVLVLAGVYSQGTEAAAEYITNKNYLAQLEQRLRQFDKPPRYFQALLKVGVENGIPTTIAILALHDLER